MAVKILQMFTWSSEAGVSSLQAFAGGSKRSMIEPVIGHCKTNNRLDGNYLKGTQGDKINAIMSACGFNIRRLLRKILFWLQGIDQILQMLRQYN